jgi:hypothetical protein
MPFDNPPRPTTLEPPLEEKKPKRQRLFDSLLERAAAAVDDAIKAVNEAKKNVKKAKKQVEDKVLFLALAVAECRRQYDAAHDKPKTWAAYRDARFTMSESYLEAMLAIGRSADPPAALKEYHRRLAERQAKSRPAQDARKVAKSGGSPKKTGTRSMSHQKSDRAGGWLDMTVAEADKIKQEAIAAGEDPDLAVNRAQLDKNAYGWFKVARDKFDFDERIDIVNRVIDVLGLKHIVPEVKRLSDVPLDQAA